MHACHAVNDYPESLNLDTLLIKIRTQVTPRWYEFGRAVGIAKEVLNSYRSYPPEECIVEMLDYWLRNCDVEPCWEDVANALRKIKLYQLADSIYTQRRYKNITSV